MKRLGIPVPEVIPKSITTSEINIEDYLVPILNEAGYQFQWISRTDVRQEMKLLERWSKIDPKLLYHGRRLLLEVAPLNDPHSSIIVQPFVIESIDKIKNLPRYNLPPELVDELESRPEGIRVKIVYNLLDCLNIHFLIVTKTGQFWADRFSGIPESEFVLTYRKADRRKDRIQVKTEIQNAKFHSVQKELKNQLHKLIYL